MLGYRKRVYGVSVEGVGNCVEVWEEVWRSVGGGIKNVWGVCEEVRGEVWKSVLGCGGR